MLSHCGTRAVEKHAGRSDCPWAIDISGNEVVSDLGCRTAARLDAVLGSDRSRPYAEDSVVRDVSMGALIVDRNSILLVVINDVTHDPGRASSPLDPSSHLHCHTTLVTTKGIVADLSDVIPKDVR